MKEYNVLESNQKWFKDNSLDLDDALGEISIQDVEEGELIGWFAVVDTDGINAYFSTETEALAYRLFLINRILNG
jgi:hypothetical protein